jgi:hypothetical protein
LRVSARETASRDAGGLGAVLSCGSLTAASRPRWTDPNRTDLAGCAPRFAPALPESGVPAATGAGVRFRTGLFDGWDSPDGTQRGPAEIGGYGGIRGLVRACMIVFSRRPKDRITRDQDKAAVTKTGADCPFAADRLR